MVKLSQDGEIYIFTVSSASLLHPHAAVVVAVEAYKECFK